MANVRIENKVEKKEVVKIVEETTKVVVLELTEEEAVTLRAIVGSVAGDNTKSPRKHTYSIYDALNKAGYDYWSNSKVAHAVDRMTGSIRFSND